MVDLALTGLPLTGTFCDFACGSGHFLVAEAERRQAAGQPPAVVAQALFGRDLDAQAVATCRARLVALLGAPAVFEAHIEVGDGLAPFGRTFDVVAGNPPYRGGRLAELSDHLRDQIPTAAYQLDPYLLFLDRALRLLAPGGRAVLVTPETWLTNRHAGALRAFLLGRNTLERLVRLPATTFPAVVETCLAWFQAGGITAPQVPVFDEETRRIATLLFDAAAPDASVSMARDPAVARLLATSRGWTTTLAEVAEVTRGVNPYHHSLHAPEEIAARIHHADQCLGPEWRPELRGRHLAPYQVAWAGDTFIRYGPGLKEPRHPRFFEGPRLLVRKILGTTVHAAYTEAPFVCDQSVYIVRPRPGQPWDLHTLLGCLNSRLMADLLRARHGPHQHLFPQLKVADLKEFPLPEADPAGPQARAVATLARVGTGGESLEEAVRALYGA